MEKYIRSVLEDIFINGEVPLNAEYGVYIPYLIFLSYLIAVLGCFAGLRIVSEIQKTKSRNVLVFKYILGAFAFGGSIWSMHFIGMLAYRMDMLIEYDPLLTVLSMCIAGIAAFGFLYVSKDGILSIKQLLLGSVLLGVAICGMHYTGMAAMQMDADLRYRPLLFICSVVVAIATSLAALWIIMRLSRQSEKNLILSQILAALVMGVAICGMHYTGMAAAVFIPYADCRYVPNQDHTNLVFIVSGITFILLGMTAILGSRDQVTTGKDNLTLFGKHSLYAPAIFVLLCGIMITFFANYFVGEGQIKLAKQEFRRVADDYNEEFRSEMRLYIQGVDSITSLFNASSYVDEREFHAFVDPLLKKTSYIEAVYYAPMIPSNSYYQLPISYAATQEKPSDVRGHDLASLMPVGRFNVENLDTTQKFFIDYVPESIDLDAVVNGDVILVSYVRSMPDDKAKVEQEGYLFSVLNVPALQEAAYHRMHANNIKIYDTKAAQFIASKDSGSTFTHTNTVTVLNKNWQFGYIAKEGDFKTIGETQYFVLSIGFIASLGISIYMLMLLKQRQKDHVARVSLNTEIIEKERLNAQMQIYTDKLEEARMEAYEERDKAEKANQAKSEFLANMSHELRTPLNSVIGLSKMLAEDAADKSEEKEMSTSIHKSAGYLLDIVNDILDLSKIEAGEVVLENIGFDLKVVVANVLESLAPIASAKGLSLHYTYQCADLPYLKGDPLRMSRILNNLVGNAIKYTSEGHIDIIIDAHQKDGNTLLLTCSVIDSGIGIPQDKLATIFQKFSQADETTTRRYGGTGLGLAITKELVELMQGEIGVISELGKGSEFQISIPFEITQKLHQDILDPVKTAHTQIHDKKSVMQARILVAEDHDLNQMLVQKLLFRNQVHHADIVPNGRDALSAYKDQQYDLIFMDCHMPEMNGYRATQEIREYESFRKIKPVPIIALTADAIVGTRDKCLSAGMDDYLTKPIDADAFQRLLRHYFEYQDDNVKQSQDVSLQLVSHPL